MPSKLLAFLLLLVALVVTPHAARADDPASRAARRHFERGEKLFQMGKFDDALDEYQKAYEAKPEPDFLFNIGQCQRNIGNYDQAIFSFKQYLKLSPDAPNKEAVSKLIEELEDKKARVEGEKISKTTPQGPHEDPPLYTRWWFWTGVGVVAAAAGTGLFVYESHKVNPPMTDLGNINFGK